MSGLPFRPGDWAVDSTERVARVSRVYALGDEVLIDLSIYSHRGDRIGRQSPACGGPKSFEPACDARHWERIKRPDFPVVPKWVPNGDGTVSLRLWAGPRLPPANWTPPQPSPRVTSPRSNAPDFFSIAELRHLVDLFSGANDPLSASIADKAGRWADLMEIKR